MLKSYPAPAFSVVPGSCSYPTSVCMPWMGELMSVMRYRGGIDISLQK